MLLIGTDCSGLDAPIFALRKLQVKYKHVFASDIDLKCRLMIEANTIKNIFSDMTLRKHTPKVDMYICGFPCQPFSIAGMRKGINEKKGLVFFHCYDYIKTNKPSVFILENVKGLLNIMKGETFKEILKLLKDIGIYNIYWKLLNTKDYGIPQSRPRVYIIGILKDVQVNDFAFPNTVPCIPLHTFIDKSDERKHPIVPCIRGILNSLPINSVFIDRAFSKNKHPNSDKYTPCLCARSSFWCVPLRRRINVEEARVLQGFPSTIKQVISDGQLIARYGNSMSVNVLCLLFQCVFEAIDYPHIPVDIHSAFCPVFK